MPAVPLLKTDEAYLILGILNLGNLLANKMRNTDHKGVTHAKGPVAVRHARIGPTARKSLQLFELVRKKTPQTPADLDTCLNREGPDPPSPVRIVLDGLSTASGKDIFPSE